MQQRTYGLRIATAPAFGSVHIYTDLFTYNNSENQFLSWKNMFLFVSVMNKDWESIKSQRYLRIKMNKNVSSLWQEVQLQINFISISDKLEYVNRYVIQEASE